MEAAYRIRKGSVQGTRHINLGQNNQDAVEPMAFRIPKRGKSFRIGIVSDGCTGIPAFSNSEVGSRLLTVFSLARIQEFILGGVQNEGIPGSLYPAMTSFMRGLAYEVMPPNIHWKYPFEFEGDHAFRNKLNATQRFHTDYLMATLLGYIDDGETLVTFQAGDGVVMVDDEVFVSNQNDRPDYPALSINSPSPGFDIKTYKSADVGRLALATDGIKKLLAELGSELVDRLFEHAAENPMGLQFLLGILRRDHPELVDDDLTVTTMERLTVQEEADDGETDEP